MSTMLSTASAPDGETLPEQHSLLVSVLLHLAPGAALTVFIVIAAPMVRALGLPTVFALFAGILLVIVPIELGYLAAHARRTTGSWSPLRAVDYRAKLPPRRLALWTVGLTFWFMAVVGTSMLLLDEWLARTFFAWMPDAILQFSTVDDGEPASTVALVALVTVAFVGNGILGPVTEELYFRGHLLPRIARYGRWSPVLNTVLFSLYHFWTPWQNLARIVGFLPVSWAAWRTRSVSIAIAAHVTINVVFLLLLLAAALSGEG